MLLLLLLLLLLCSFLPFAWFGFFFFLSFFSRFIFDLSRSLVLLLLVQRMLIENRTSHKYINSHIGTHMLAITLPDSNVQIPWNSIQPSNPTETNVITVSAKSHVDCTHNRSYIRCIYTMAIDSHRTLIHFVSGSRIVAACGQCNRIASTYFEHH